MKRIFLSLLLALAISFGAKAQERYRAFNIGFGAGYYGYYYGSAPALSMNFEFDLGKNFTIAPFASVATYRSYRYWGSIYYPYRDYYYRETIIPVGVKGTYYFDQLFEAGPKWDFYTALSLGVAFRQVAWESGYYGDRIVHTTSTPLFASLHLGTEYHINNSVGLFLDVSTAFSTVGLGIHF